MACEWGLNRENETVDWGVPSTLTVQGKCMVVWMFTKWVLVRDTRKKRGAICAVTGVVLTVRGLWRTI